MPGIKCISKVYENNIIYLLELVSNLNKSQVPKASWEIFLKYSINILPHVTTIAKQRPAHKDCLWNYY